MSIHFNPKRLRRVRLISGVLLLCALAAYFGTTGREIGVHLGDGNFIAVGDACVKFGNNRDKLSMYRSAARPAGPYVLDSWRSDYAVAWRPFRAADKFSRGPMGWHMLVIPVMPLIPLFAAALGWSHGRLIGLRDGRSLCCMSCGYDLSRLPVTSGLRQCPECGAASAATHPQGMGSAAQGVSV